MGWSLQVVVTFSSCNLRHQQLLPLVRHCIYRPLAKKDYCAELDHLYFTNWKSIDSAMQSFIFFVSM